VTEEPNQPRSRSDWIEVEFVCTKSGAHRPYRLLQAMIGPGPDDFDPLTNNTSFRSADSVSLLGGGSAYDEFYCAGCGRNTRIKHDKFVALLQRLHQGGLATFDVSQLP
jgi:hypothetical protein